MPLTIHLTDDSTTIDMDAGTNYAVLMDGGTLGRPEIDRLWGQGTQTAFDALIRSIARNRTINLSLKVKDTSHDNWITKLQNLQRMVSEGERFWKTSGYLGTRCYLDIALAGASNTTRFDVLAGDIDPGVGLFSFPIQSTTAPVALGIEVILLCKPGGRPSSIVSNTGALGDNNARGISVTPAGDLDTPCKVTFSPDATIDWRFLWMYRRSLGTPTDFLRRIECEEGTFTNEVGTTDYTVTATVVTGVTYAVEADAAASSGEREDIDYAAGNGMPTNQTLLTWNITSNLATQYGKHRCYLRVRQISGTTPSVRLTYGGPNGVSRTPNSSVTPTLHATDWRLVDLGFITIPYPSIPTDITLTSYKFALQFTSAVGDLAFKWELDCLYLIPQTNADFLYVDLGAVSSAQDQFVSDLIDPRPRAYYMNSAGAPLATLFDLKEHTFFTAQRGVANLFVAFWADDANKKHVFADTAVLKVEHYPQFETFR